MFSESRKKIYQSKSIETEPLTREVLVHGAMNYKCEDCGKIFRMWLEKGLEDKIQDAIYPDKHKPVPFTIGCLCGGLAQHTAWHEDIELGTYRPLGDGMSYFENTDYCDCGRPHLKTDGCHISNPLKNRFEEIAEYMKQQVDEEKERLQALSEHRNRETGLEMYSTTQLKEELRRRKRW